MSKSPERRAWERANYFRRSLSDDIFTCRTCVHHVANECRVMGREIRHSGTGTAYAMTCKRHSTSELLISNTSNEGRA